MSKNLQLVLHQKDLNISNTPIIDHLEELARSNYEMRTTYVCEGCNFDYFIDEPCPEHS